MASGSIKRFNHEVHEVEEIHIILQLRVLRVLRGYAFNCCNRFNSSAVRGSSAG
jgi:hypothetical protein